MNLQVLIDKGVLVDEIKLYGEIKSDEALDESFCEDSFAQLEAVISKVCNSSNIEVFLLTLPCYYHFMDCSSGYYVA